MEPKHFSWSICWLDVWWWDPVAPRSAGRYSAHPCRLCLILHGLLIQYCSAGPWQPPAASSLNKAALARLQAEESSRRLVRLANETLRYASKSLDAAAKALAADLCFNKQHAQPSLANCTLNAMVSLAQFC